MSYIFVVIIFKRSCVLLLTAAAWLLYASAGEQTSVSSV